MEDSAEKVKIANQLYDMVRRKSMYCLKWYIRIVKNGNTMYTISVCMYQEHINVSPDTINVHNCMVRITS